MIRVLPSLLRNRIGPALLGSQVALTLAIVVNAAFIAGNEIQLMQQPTGLDESRLVIVHFDPSSEGVVPDATAAADLEALRQIPGVEDVARINFMPLDGRGWRTGVDRKPFAGPGPALAHAALYFGDPNLPSTLGLKIVDGRGFSAEDVGDMNEGLSGDVRVALISRALADRLYPGESPIGKMVHSRTLPSVRIVGVIERMQSTWPSRDMHENSLLIPARLHLTDAMYAIQAQPAALEHVASAIRPTLQKLDSARVIDEVSTYPTIRAAVYSNSRSLSLMLGTLIIALLFITALGVGGTAAFWVASRTQQIGTRRALGARRGDILRHFMLENFFITSAGVALGSVLALMLNQWLATHYHVPALAWWLVPAAIVLQYALGQMAVLGPAMRAAAVPPAVATRGA